MTTKTRDQIAADFAAVFDSMEPAKKTAAATEADRLEPYRKEVLKQRQRGFTWKQIALGMGDPRIGEKVSHKTLARRFGEKPAEPNPARQRLILDPVTNQPIATPARQRLILDPATNKPIVMPAAAPVPPPAIPPVRKRLILDPATGKPIA